MSGNRKALLVGCNYKGTSSQLRGCINDVRDIKNLLETRFNYPSGNIELLIDEAGYVYPTRANILAKLRAFIQSAKKGDILFFHYSGHGTYIRDTNGDESDGRDECIVPLDYNSAGIITDDLLRSIINQVPQGTLLTAILDSCFSGTGFDLRFNYQYRRQRRLRRFRGRRAFIYRWELTPLPERRRGWTAANVFLFSGCRDNQESADTYEDGKFVGAMSWGFRKIVQTNDINNMTYYTFLAKLRQLLRNRGYTQIPQLSSGRQLYAGSKIHF